MSTFRELVKISSGLGEGVMLRTHLLNLGSGGGDIFIGTPLTGNIDHSLSGDIDYSLTGDVDDNLSGSFNDDTLSGDISSNNTGNI